MQQNKHHAVRLQPKLIALATSMAVAMLASQAQAQQAVDAPAPAAQQAVATPAVESPAAAEQATAPAAAPAAAGASGASGAQAASGSSAAPAGQASGADANANTVVVTGFRASLNSALNTKKNADGIVDVIKAEDISKFPDANLAESLQRVPGVALERGDGGEGKQITVRGLNAGFTRVRINGIEGVAATGASDINGSTNRGRGFDFSVFASELFNSLSVRKTSEAAVEEGSLGATVDLRTGRPFDFKGRTISFGLQESYREMGKKTQPRVTGLISDRWETPYGRFGALISGAWSKRRAQEEGYEAVSIVAANTDGGFCSPLGVTPQTPANNPVKGVTATSCGTGADRLSNAAAYNDVFSRRDDYGGLLANPAAGNGAFHPRIPRFRRSMTDYERLGMTGALQWKPNADTDVNLDLMYGKFDNIRYDNYISAISFGRTMDQANGKPQTSIVDAHFNENGSWDYGKFNDVDIRSEGLVDVYKTIFKQHVFTVGHRFSDTLRGNFMHGVSDSKLDEPMRATVQFDAPNVDGFSFDFRQNRNVPILNFGIDVSDPKNFTFGPQEANGTLHGQFVGRYLKTTNRLQTTQADVEWEVNDHITLKTGFSARKNRWTNLELGSGGNGLTLPAGTTVADYTQQITGFGKNLGGTGVPTSWATVDLDKFRAAWDIECHCAAVPGSEYNYLTQSNRNVEEKINAVFGMVDFNYDVGPVTFRGNLGVRGAETKLSSMALINVNGQLTPNYGYKKYRDWLPALNLTAILPNDVFLRFSAGKVLSRPDYVGLTPSVSVNTTGQSVSIGNPNLDPIRANTFDVQGEWYYAKNAMVGLGIFRKDMKSFIQGVSELQTYSSLGIPNDLLQTSTGCSITGGTPACPTQPDTLVTVSRQVNTSGGPLNGAEFSWQTPFSFLPGAWSNFGMMANVTRVKSKIKYLTRLDNPRTTTNEELSIITNFTGLSPRANNFTLYYDDEKFSARVSRAYRSSYYRAIRGNVDGHDYLVADASTTYDMSTSYQVTPQLRISFEAQNLSNEPTRYYNDTQRQDTLLYVRSGRTLVLGASYKF
ncbi:TonB-dependent receptor [Massilia dura]|uniref:TonB-dependent receptor n=1 Tax=Pseudoduganella dura TaxID=321982 RepID=A0A6I3XG39_9BURK|nr:TonB-dependent receptor [Pseudoduganella dura]MUI15417.1 TonB-dependent receptor [Pseudoduganella dura]GGX80056.1 TonB-dependent receptor [Pseudoduganella dura]